MQRESTGLSGKLLSRKRRTGRAPEAMAQLDICLLQFSKTKEGGENFSEQLCNQLINVMCARE
jgi:hypothetical protein